MSGAFSRDRTYCLPIVLIHINDNLHGVPENVGVAMFFLDVSFSSGHSNKEVVEAVIQQAISNLANWRSRHKLTLNDSKYKVAFFINSLHEARRQPSNLINASSPHNRITNVLLSYH